MNDELPRKRSSGTSTERRFSIEARFDFPTPQEVAGHLIDNRWQELHFTESPIGVPTQPNPCGLCSYPAAQALRWWFHAVAEIEHKDLCLETRLIEHKIEVTHIVTAIAEHKHIGGDDRSSMMPNWGEKAQNLQTQ